MKKRLNLICLGIVLAVLVSMSFLFSTFYYGFKAGIDAYEQGAAGVEKLDVTYKMIGTMPTDVITNETATAINEKNGSTVSILPFISMIGIPNEKADATDSIFLSLLDWMVIICCIYAIVQFVKMIRNIHRNIIFDWANVKRLRRLGLSLILCFCCSLVTFAINNHLVSQVISLKDCDFSIAFQFSDPTLLIGFTSLLFAEIFAIGLRLKEENDLTI
ncbi:DUF2975 domain-containing protein [Bacteroides gallinaceum]|uniref:DUF2975 domain-containing protein n=1 Tax=Bacteroides gallinaceum TaxID=1462571 RepID=A0ABT7XAN0_9BACE|nr:DUF2975 domain-containing protein [Bacteroides gallinaceum]MDN0051137.1 DUF2975 domain-containing protein [Bacteroides gallinaceum]MDN0067225.1 DUF2975 domain-containing protein [Bacteroides gallinaceum]